MPRTGISCGTLRSAVECGLALPFCASVVSSLQLRAQSAYHVHQLLTTNTSQRRQSAADVVAVVYSQKVRPPQPSTLSLAETNAVGPGGGGAQATSPSRWRRTHGHTHDNKYRASAASRGNKATDGKDDGTEDTQPVGICCKNVCNDI